VKEVKRTQDATAPIVAVVGEWVVVCFVYLGWCYWIGWIEAGAKVVACCGVMLFGGWKGGEEEKVRGNEEGSIKRFSFDVTPRNAAARDTLKVKAQTKLAVTGKDAWNAERHNSINMGSCLPYQSWYAR
jgi:hypothetical protein